MVQKEQVMEKLSRKQGVVPFLVKDLTTVFITTGTQAMGKAIHKDGPMLSQ